MDQYCWEACSSSPAMKALLTHRAVIWGLCYILANRFPSSACFWRVLKQPRCEYFHPTLTFHWILCSASECHFLAELVKYSNCGRMLLNALNTQPVSFLRKIIKDRGWSRLCPRYFDVASKWNMMAVRWDIGVVKQGRSLQSSFIKYFQSLQLKLKKPDLFWEQTWILFRRRFYIWSQHICKKSGLMERTF